MHFFPFVEKKRLGNIISIFLHSDLNPAWHFLIFLKGFLVVWRWKLIFEIVLENILVHMFKMDHSMLEWIWMKVQVPWKRLPQGERWPLRNSNNQDLPCWYAITKYVNIVLAWYCITFFHPLKHVVLKIVFWSSQKNVI